MAIDPDDRTLYDDLLDRGWQQPPEYQAVIYVNDAFAVAERWLASSVLRAQEEERELREQLAQTFNARVMEVDEGRAPLTSLYVCDCCDFNCTTESPHAWHSGAAALGFGERPKEEQ